MKKDIKNLEEKTMKDREKEKLVRLLELGNFKEAREYADYLLKKGISKTHINYTSYPCFKRYVRGYYSNKKTAEELSRHFDSYHWELWLNNPHF